MTQSGRKFMHSGLSARPGGSVLLFAIVLLALLAMLGTTFALFVRQNRMAASNTEANLETNAAVDAGREHALALIHKQLMTHAIVARKTIGNEYHVGVYNPNGVNPSWPYTFLDADYLAWDGVTLASAPPVDIAFWHFENNVTGATGPVLSIYPNTTATNTRYTTSPLGTRESGGPEVALLTEIQGYTNDLYKYPLPTNYPIKQTPRISSVRGDYAVWISDLDARLYAIPASWGIDVNNTPTPPQPSALLTAILNFEYTDAAMVEHSLSPSLTNDLMSVPAANTNDSRFPQYRTTQDLATVLPTLQNAATNDPQAYLLLRQQLDYYFAVYLDTPLSGNVVKDGSAALNINTAPVEVIAAAISQIPADTDGDTFSTAGGLPNPGRAYRIAQRIVAKRPFLCRMDFEDFLAAHLKGKSSDSTAAAPTGDLPPDGDPTWSPSNPMWTDAPTAYMVYFAMSKRWGPGGQILAPDGVTAVNRELSLSQYLEMQGVSDTEPAFKKTINGHDSWPNFPEYQKERFRYFFNDRAGLTDEFLTPKEFNNFINSVTSAGNAANDDVQVKPPDPSVTNLAETDLVITPGPDGVLGSLPSGDDYPYRHIVPTPTTLAQATADGVDQIINGKIYPAVGAFEGELNTQPQVGDVVVVDGIVAGPDGTVSSFVSYNRPSYYSYFDDATYAGASADWGFWDQIKRTLAAESSNPAVSGASSIGDAAVAALIYDPSEATPITIKDAEYRAFTQMKFYYRLSLSASATVGSPPTVNDAKMQDLLSWRCNPVQSALTQGRAGFYQIAFNDWTTSYGPMQASGEPPFDPTDPDTDYSTASKYSGSKFNGDVAWSPQFAFRSRYFGVYVLGRGKVQGWNTPEVNPDDPQLRSKLKVTGERRLEAVYDALKDEIIWQRTPVTDKHSLAEP